MQAHHEDRSHRNELICEHVEVARRLARNIARRLPSAVRRDDLESAALLGLTEAATRFDPTRGEPFGAFATKRVRGAVLDELRHNDILTRRGRESARHIARATKAVEGHLGRMATTEEIATQLGLPLDEVQVAIGRLQPSLVLLDEERDMPHESPFAAPDQQVAEAQSRRAVLLALRSLASRDLEILSMYFRDELTLQEIGHILGVSESRVSQLRTRALQRLRLAMEAADAVPGPGKRSIR